MKNYGKLTAAIIAGWFTLALSASALQAFTNPSLIGRLAVGFAALLPLVVFALWFAASASFRQFTLSLNPRVLTIAQAGRFVGFIFVLLEARGVLPAVFALPAGYGDMAIGLTAGFAAWMLANPAHRRLFILWQMLGIADLVSAVSIGAANGPVLSANGASMSAMTVLPLSLIPTFLVPLYFIFHVICIAQARTWASASDRRPMTFASMVS